MYLYLCTTYVQSQALSVASVESKAPSVKVDSAAENSARTIKKYSRCHGNRQDGAEKCAIDAAHLCRLPSLPKKSKAPTNLHQASAHT